MRTAIHQYLKAKGIGRSTSAVEDALALHKEACELRLARIQNGKEPSHVNGHPKSTEKTGCCAGKPPIRKKN
jgi:hypothetical protein